MVALETGILEEQIAEAALAAAAVAAVVVAAAAAAAAAAAGLSVMARLSIIPGSELEACVSSSNHCQLFRSSL